MTDNDFINDLCEGLKSLSVSLTEKHSLVHGVVEIVLLETLAKTLHGYAPAETGRFLDELSFGEMIDPLVLDGHRDDLADVLEGILRH